MVCRLFYDHMEEDTCQSFVVGFVLYHATYRFRVLLQTTHLKMFTKRGLLWLYGGSKRGYQVAIY